MLELTSVHHHFLCSFRMVKKKPFCNPWGHCCGWTNEISCFYLITWKGLVLSSATHSKDLYSRDQGECFSLMQELLEFILAQHLSDSTSLNKTYRICTLGDSRLNCLKTIPFTAAYTYIAHIWQYPPPPKYFLLSPACCTKIITDKKTVMVYTTSK